MLSAAARSRTDRQTKVSSNGYPGRSDSGATRWCRRGIAGDSDRGGDDINYFYLESMSMSEFDDNFLRAVTLVSSIYAYQKPDMNTR